MNRVVVTGMGAISCFGDSADELWQALLAGRPGIRRIPRLAGSGLPVTTGGAVEALLPERLDRDEEMSRRPIAAALAQAGLDAAGAGLVWAIGLDTFAPGPEGPVQRLAGACFAAVSARFSGPRRMIATACASATQAIGRPFTWSAGGGCRPAWPAAPPRC